MKLPLKLLYFEIVVTQQLSPFSFCLLSSLGTFIYSHFQAKAFMKCHFQDLELSPKVH